MLFHVEFQEIITGEGLSTKATIECLLLGLCLSSAEVSDLVRNVAKVVQLALMPGFNHFNVVCREQWNNLLSDAVKHML